LVFFSRRKKPSVVKNHLAPMIKTSKMKVSVTQTHILDHHVVKKPAPSFPPHTTLSKSHPRSALLCKTLMNCDQRLPIGAATSHRRANQSISGESNDEYSFPPSEGSSPVFACSEAERGLLYPSRAT